MSIIVLSISALDAVIRAPRGLGRERGRETPSLHIMSARVGLA
jgi:hypothetical protein